MTDEKVDRYTATAFKGRIKPVPTFTCVLPSFQGSLFMDTAVGGASIHTLSLQLNPKINPFGVLSSGESLGEIPSTHFRTSFGSVLYLCNTIHKLTSCRPSQQSNRVPVSCVIQSYAPLHWSIVNTGHWTSDRRIDNNGDNRSEGLYVAMNRV